MGAFVTYVLQTGIFLLVFYLFNRLFLSRETFHKFNRIVWLLIIPLSLILPFCIPGSFDPVAWFGRQQTQGQAVVMPEGTTLGVLGPSEHSGAAVRMVQGFLLIYFTGVLVTFIFYVISYVKLLFVINKNKDNGRAAAFENLLAECRKLTGTGKKVRLIVHADRMVPFSWMRYIVVSEQDMMEDGKTILIHELSHVREGHSWDLVLTDLLILFQWFNPAAWLFKQSMQQVHEFQADDYVLKTGVNAKQYQLLLIKKAVGTRCYSMVNSFNHSKLKKRITMMWKKKSNKWAFAKCIYALPLAFIAVTAFATPEISGTFSGISSVKDIKISPESPAAVPVAEIVQGVDQDTLVPLAILDTKPLFVNGEGEGAFTRWVFEQIKYPEEAHKKGIEGRVVASFVLNKEGNVTNVEILRGVDPLLDAETIRVLESSPKWERPGISKGKRVPVRYNFPLNFSLRKDKVDNSQVKQSTDPKDLGLEPAVPVQQDTAFSLALVDSKPLFADGKDESEFTRWVMTNLKYPEEAKKKGIQGRVVVSFELSKTGQVANVKVLRGANPELDNEVVRVVESSPVWERPGQSKGKTVRVHYVVPVNFSLPKDQPDTVN
ncbi:MAG: M56 family metallopeptidase [Bacteroidales bacterium]